MQGKEAWGMIDLDFFNDKIMSNFDLKDWPLS